MAHHAGVVRKSDILILIVYTLCFDGTPGSWLVVDNESALDVDLDSAGVGDSFLQAIGALARRIDAFGSHCDDDERRDRG